MQREKRYEAHKSTGKTIELKEGKWQTESDASPLQRALFYLTRRQTAQKP
ncbi:hypothetical protein [Hornefia butyriciproducens]|nr:hypothetical protein [Hornefia butyriciproducens]